MTDIGFGLLDHRTVITVLFTLVLMQLLFGLQIPVDIKNVVQLFIDLVVLTGYIYLARTIYRLPVAMIISSSIGIQTLTNLIKGGVVEVSNILEPINYSRLIKGFIITFLCIITIVFIPIAFLIMLLYLLFTFGELIEDKGKVAEALPEKLQMFFIRTSKPWGITFGILDRVGVVAIAVMATIPAFSNFVKVIGVSGVVVMIALFTLRGDFSALIKDILEKKDKEKDKEEKTESAIEVKNSRYSPMYVEIVNTNENPVKINNSPFEPLYVDVDKHNPLRVEVENRYSIPVHVDDIVQVSTSHVSPLQVEIENYLPISVEIENSSPISVEVTNVVTTQEDDG